MSRKTGSTSDGRRTVRLRRNKSSEKKNFECQVCQSVVEDDDEGIECEICRHWFHPKCANITDNEYDVLTTHQTGTIHWYCENCNNKSVQMLQLVFGLQDRLQKVESDLGSIRNEITIKMSKIECEYDAVREDLKNLSQKIDTGIKQCQDDSVKQIRSLQNETQNHIEKINKAIDSKIDKDYMESALGTCDEDDGNNTWVKVAEKHVDAKLGQAASEVQSMQKALQNIRDAAKEEEDKESRRNNIIMYKVPESDALLAGDRNLEDKRFCEQLLFSLNVGVADEDIRKVFRLGRRGTDVPGSRPVLIQLGNHTVKSLIMENLYKLKSLPEKFKKVIVAHDMTKKERGECKALVESAKFKNENESGEWVYRVRGPPGRMEIVQFRKPQQSV